MTVTVCSDLHLIITTVPGAHGLVNRRDNKSNFISSIFSEENHVQVDSGRHQGF